MAEIVLNSNESSSLFSSSKAAAGADSSAYTYSTMQSGVNKFTEHFIRSPINNASFGGGSASVNIPQFGILREMVVHTQIKYNIKAKNTVPVIAKALFSQIIDQVSLKNSSRELQVIYGDTIRHSVYSLGSEKSKKWRILGQDDLLITDVNGYGGANTAVVTTTALLAANSYNRNRRNPVVKFDHSVDHVIDVYTVLPFSMFPGFGSNKDTPFKNLLNTRFIETLKLDIKYADRIKVLNASGLINADFGFTVEPTISSAELICKFDIISNPELKKIEAANYAISSPLAMILGNYSKVSTAFVPTESTAKPTVQLFDTSLAHSILITCKKVSTGVQYINLNKLVNLKTCNITSTGIVGATQPSEEFAQITEGYGTSLTKARSSLGVDLTALVLNTADAALLVSTQNPLPLTNKHAIPITLPNDTYITGGAGGGGFVAYEDLDDEPKKVTFGVGTCRPGEDLQTIKTIKLTSAGRILYETKNSLESLLMGNSMLTGGQWYSNAEGHVSELADLNNQNGCSPYNMYEIVFGDHSTNTDAIRGCLSMKNLNSLQLDFEINDLVPNANYEINVFVKKYSAISISASDGRVSTAVST